VLGCPFTASVPCAPPCAWQCDSAESSRHNVPGLRDINQNKSSKHSQYIKNRKSTLTSTVQHYCLAGEGNDSAHVECPFLTPKPEASFASKPGAVNSRSEGPTAPNCIARRSHGAQDWDRVIIKAITTTHTSSGARLYGKNRVSGIVFRRFVVSTPNDDPPRSLDHSGRMWMTVVVLASL
jgi:hypothetical protein